MNDSKFERALYDEVVEKALNDVPKEEHEFSPEFKAKMEKLIDRRKKPYYAFIATAGRRVAVVAICLLISLSALTLSVRAFFPETWGVILEQIGGFIGVSFKTDADSELSYLGEIRTPEYIPEGFESTLIDKTDLSVYISYTDSLDHVITYTQHPMSDLSLMVSNSYTPTPVSVAGHDAVLFVGEGKILTWSDGVFIIRIEDYSGMLTDEMLLTMAESAY